MSGTDPTPAAGESLPEAILIREHGWNLEIRLYDGLSTGLFLDQRENRRFVADWVKDRARGAGKPPTVLNTFAYTCAFSVAAATAGALPLLPVSRITPISPVVGRNKGALRLVRS